MDNPFLFHIAIFHCERKKVDSDKILTAQLLFNIISILETKAFRLLKHSLLKNCNSTEKRKYESSHGDISELS